MSQPLRILHVIAVLDGYGLSNQLRVLVDLQRSAGHDVQVLALTADRTVWEAWPQQRIACELLEQRWRYDPFVAWRMAGYLRKGNFDFIHPWDGQSLEYVRFARPRDARVLTTHMQNGGMNVPPGITKPVTCSHSRQDFLAELSLPTETQLIAVASKHVRHQRVEEAIWCAELVRNINPRARLVVFGEGPERARWERFTRLATSGEGVRFVGYREDFRELLTLVDVFWHAGEAGDVVPISVLEAMVAEVPVILTESNAAKEFMEEGANGYTVPLAGRAIRARHTLKLLENAELAQKIGLSAAKTISQHFTPGQMKAAYDALYTNEMTTTAQPVAAL